MAGDERRTYLDAAFRALSDLPIDAIERGATAAMRTVDHPSKIVPAIRAAMTDDLSWRRRMASARPRAAVALPEPDGHQVTSSEVDELCRKFRIGRYSAHQAVVRGADPAVSDVGRETHA